MSNFRLMTSWKAFSRKRNENKSMRFYSKMRSSQCKRYASNKKFQQRREKTVKPGKVFIDF